MLATIFSSILSFSITASTLYLIFLVAFHFRKKYLPPKYNKIALLVILTFFILPIGRLSHLFFHAIIPKEQINFISSFTISPPLPSSVNRDFSKIPQRNTTQTSAFSVFYFFQNNWFSVLAIIWLAVMLILFLRKIYVTHSFSKKIKTITKPMEDKRTLSLYLSTADKLDITSPPSLYSIHAPCSPFIKGLFSPTIFLSKQNFTDAELKLIFKHELTHYKNKDLWIKNISSIICIIQWFNPFVWLVNKNLEISIEETCDAQVTNTFNFKQKQFYATTILHISQMQSTLGDTRFISTFSNSNKKNMKERLSSMLNTKKCTKKIIAISSAALIALCGIGFTVSAAMYTPTSSDVSSLSQNTPSSLENSSIHSTSIEETRNTQEAIASATEEPTEKTSNPASATSEMTPEQSLGFINPVPDVKYIGRGKNDLHRGIDLKAPEGTDIVAASDGTVILAAENHYSYGNYAIIDHGNGYTTTYAHCQDILVSEGQIVSAGQVIAHVGHTGNSSGNHLHFELAYNETLQNPTDYIQFSELA